jgi:tRNA A-37 threonylcarbamoyl transferase component Bud32
MSTPETFDAAFRRRVASALGEAYELRGELGRGGFAVVYAAWDRQLKRDLAVKVLRAELADDAAIRTRFRREAEAIARLRHPHIVPIYAVGAEQDLAWFIMPLVAGESLRVRLDRERRLAIGETRRVLREAATALAAAHRAGIVHRDIKPDNIMLEGDEGRVLLMDFGIAKALEPDLTAAITRTGTVVGTPQYMSPEQASGERELDARSDLYSLGVVAYQMLAGEVPFTGPTVAAILLQQVGADAPPVTRKRPDCPADLAAAVQRCLAKAPDARWASAEDLARALTAGEAAVTTEARRASGAALFGVADPRRRFRWLLVGAAVAVGALVVVDALRGSVLFAPVGILVAAGVVAAKYGRLWTAGYSWRDLLGRGSAGGPSSSPVPPDSAEFGPHAAAIHQARADRAAILAVVQRFPRAERARVEDLRPLVDALLAQAADVARQLYALERQLDPGPDEIDRRLATTRGEPASPGRDQRLTMLERRRETIVALLGRRERVAALLAGVLAAIGRGRVELEGAEGSGLPEAAGRARAALRAMLTISPPDGASPPPRLPR